MAYLGTTQIDPVQGTLAIEFHPVAASQTLKQGDPVYLNAGLVTLGQAAGTNLLVTDHGGVGYYGIMAQDASSLATNTLVAVHPFNDNVVLTLPSYHVDGVTAPTVANVCSGAPTTGFQLRYDTGGILKVDINAAFTANPVARIYGLEMTDRHKDAKTFKTSGSYGDRVRVKILAAARQTG